VPFRSVDGDRHEAFEHVRDLERGEAVIAMAALGHDFQQPAVGQLARWPLAVCGVIPAAIESSVAVSAWPAMSAAGILARLGSPVRDANWAIQDPSIIHAA
jgi:hypothetical protein